MPRTSTAERHGYVCPLCDQPLARDHDRQGWVRHEVEPDVARIMADPAKRRMMDAADVGFLEITGICPFERGMKDAVDPLPPRFRHLAPWQGSNYRQWFYKERKIRAETLYRAIIGPDGRPPDEVARDYSVPLEAVHEAVEYCLHNEALLREERERDWASMQAQGLDRPPAPVRTGAGS